MAWRVRREKRLIWARMKRQTRNKSVARGVKSLQERSLHPNSEQLRYPIWGLRSAMLFPKWLCIVTILTACVVLPALAPLKIYGSALSQNGTDESPADPDRQEAMRLHKEHKLGEAAEWWQKVVAKYPGDMAAHEALGASLLIRAAGQSDRKNKISDRVQAHAELMRAQGLGDNSDLCKALLSAVSEDGSEVVPYPNQKEVHAALARGDAAIESLDWDDAAREYSLAVDLSPDNYFTPVGIGLKYAGLKQWEEAGKWYALSLRIKPDNGTAYGNWVAALTEAGEMKEAREKLVQGLLISDGTYVNFPLNMWLNANHLKLKKINIKVPDEYPVSKTGTMIVVDPGWLGKNDGRDAWLMYPRARRLWKKHFNESYITGYRHSLAEEVDALSQVVAAFNESLAKGNVKEPDPALMLLSRFQSEGLLEAFVLLIQHDKEVNAELYRYQTQHRDKLMEVADKYIIPPLP
jgi:tetratricopeptide (TPR) repeat protein